jgi:hypothetical protein
MKPSGDRRRDGDRGQPGSEEAAVHPSLVALPPRSARRRAAEERSASTRENGEVFHRDGLGAAFGRFMADAGFGEDDAT